MRSVARLFSTPTEVSKFANVERIPSLALPTHAWALGCSHNRYSVPCVASHTATLHRAIASPCAAPELGAIIRTTRRTTVAIVFITWLVQACATTIGTTPFASVALAAKTTCLAACHDSAYKQYCHYHNGHCNRYSCFHCSSFLGVKNTLDELLCVEICITCRVNGFFQFCAAHALRKPCDARLDCRVHKAFAPRMRVTKRRFYSAQSG